MLFFRFLDFLESCIIPGGRVGMGGGGGSYFLGFQSKMTTVKVIAVPSRRLSQKCFP